MLRFSARETEALEIMDDPECDPAALERTYAHFALVNRLVAGWGRVYRRQIFPLARRGPVSVLDLGSGGGDLARALATWARRDGISLAVTAVDPDPRAHEFASRNGRGTPVGYECASSTDLVEEGRRFDVVVSNHVLHHLDEVTLAGFLADSLLLARTRVLHSDIARSLPAYAAYWAATRLTFPGSFIHADGLLSIRRSYRPQELAAAAPTPWHVERPWPARLLLAASGAGRASARA